MTSEDDETTTEAVVTYEQVEEFDRVSSQLASFKRELTLISNKKPDGPINKFKIKLINELLEAINPVLGENFRPFKEFLTFDESDLPTASDVVVILAQYSTGMDRFKNAHQFKRNPYGQLEWNYGEEEEDDDDDYEDEDEDEDDNEP